MRQRDRAGKRKKEHTSTKRAEKERKMDRAKKEAGRHEKERLYHFGYPS